MCWICAQSASRTASTYSSSVSNFGQGSPDMATGNVQIDALLLGYSWTGEVGRGVEITYQIGEFTNDPGVPSAIPSNEIETVESILDINKQYQSAIGKVLAEYARVANISFDRELPSSINPTLSDIMFATYEVNEGLLGFAPPREFDGENEAKITGGNNFLLNDYVENNELDPGEEGYLVLLHEVGHTLGLSHPSDGTSNSGDILPSDQLTWDSSVMMTPFPSPGTHATESNLPRSLMYNDILAIQYLYGANTSYNAGNTVYQFNGTAEARTLWDGGGTDSIDQSLAGIDITLDLREGPFFVSIIGLARIWIANGAKIENATAGAFDDTVYGNGLSNILTGNAGDDTMSGGFGDDTIIGNLGNDVINGEEDNDRLLGRIGDDIIDGGAGNDFINGNIDVDILFGGLGNDTIRGGRGDDILFGEAGSDTLYGDIGNDRLNGGSGFDVFVIGEGGGADSIEDFQLAGAGLGDVIQLSSTIFSTFSEVFAATTFTPTAAVIDFGGGNSLTLLNVTTLGENDFSFV